MYTTVDGLAVREVISGAFFDVVIADGFNSHSCTKVCDELENVDRSSMMNECIDSQSRLSERGDKLKCERV